ncbi:hypothetical protein RM572_22020 [Streptomyces sp. DSM 42041]|uniref:Uncharacterized protein n=1 Tax=Streptomyces hazeniae TaxID=3075538 RepID=A0ABU2NWS8_9ACTN|nr:hypothetical protein [Streptomyces sp. DSM 42041]MDT0381440.1 hypothetical protein [Streptomyces sp. DSM 42041]
MATVGYANLPVPGGGDAPTGPAAVAALAQALDPHLVQHAVDIADRDATFASAPLHTLVTAEDGSAWLKTSAAANVWATVYEPDPEWRPLALATGHQTSSFRPEVRRIGSQVWIRGQVERTDSAVIPNTGVALGTVPNDCVPQDQPGQMAVVCSMAGDPTVPAGRIEVLDANTSSSVGGPGTVVWWSQQGEGVSWVNLGGGTYWID